MKQPLIFSAMQTNPRREPFVVAWANALDSKLTKLRAFGYSTNKKDSLQSRGMELAEAFRAADITVIELMNDAFFAEVSREVLCRIAVPTAPELRKLGMEMDAWKKEALSIGVTAVVGNDPATKKFTSARPSRKPKAAIASTPEPTKILVEHKQGAWESEHMSFIVNADILNEAVADVLDKAGIQGGALEEVIDRCLIALFGRNIETQTPPLCYPSVLREYALVRRLFNEILRHIGCPTPVVTKANKHLMQQWKRLIDTGTMDASEETQKVAAKNISPISRVRQRMKTFTVPATTKFDEIIAKVCVHLWTESPHKDYADGTHQAAVYPWELQTDMLDVIVQYVIRSIIRPGQPLLQKWGGEQGFENAIRARFYTQIEKWPSMEVIEGIVAKQEEIELKANDFVDAPQEDMEDILQELRKSNVQNPKGINQKFARLTHDLDEVGRRALAASSGSHNSAKSHKPNDVPTPSSPQRNYSPLKQSIHKRPAQTIAAPVMQSLTNTSEENYV